MTTALMINCVWMLTAKMGDDDFALFIIMKEPAN